MGRHASELSAVHERCIFYHKPATGLGKSSLISELVGWVDLFGMKLLQMSNSRKASAANLEEHTRNSWELLTDFFRIIFLHRWPFVLLQGKLLSQ